MITVSNKNNYNNTNTDSYNSNNNNDNKNEQRIINNLMNNKLFNIESSIHLGKRNRNEIFILNSNNKKQKSLKELREPKNYYDIFNLNDKNEWLKSVDNEFNSMRNPKVYETIDKIPKNANLISSI